MCELKTAHDWQAEKEVNHMILAFMCLCICAIDWQQYQVSTCSLYIVCRIILHVLCAHNKSGYQHPSFKYFSGARQIEIVKGC